ncbi:hypothetical protein E2493_02610 [Sphingomonas parva]|uniref:DUF4935 domain-containing protein n=1 Tax=Sphingomonas parva TaxID=2555898 RepID=A0A4Y8ZXZ0_9SPHN|nr:hypothetical protein [Sphingomonas parva]TFI59749.1 hypothetical protein E2493_02610 [Sphingomonas parva]
MRSFDAAEIAARGVPVLCIDTCSLLDIMRDPTREDARPNERRASIDLVARIEAGDLVCLVAEQVRLEFGTLDLTIQTQAVNALKALREQVERVNEIHNLFLPAVPISLVHLDMQVAPARAVVGRWLAAATSAPGSGDALARAMDRVNRNITPARQGREVKDCVVFETYLEAITKVRAAGMPATAVMLSSNTKEYLSERRVLKADIASDFTRVNMSFAPNMAAAKNLLGF